MQRLIRPATLLLLLAVLLSGCSFRLPRLLRFERDKPAAQEAPPVVAEQPTPPPPPVLADVLFPEKDWRINYAVTDLGKDPVQVVEDLIRDGNRMVATYNGTPYVNWVFNDDGVWRMDPKGGGALLRYLPKNLVDGEAWKQKSGSAEVWFRLKESRDACAGWFWAGQPEHCWELTVLNRGEKTVFALVTGLGPTFAQAENWATPRESFEKKATSHRTNQLDPEQRKKVLESFKPPTAAPAPVTPVTGGEFEATFTAMMGEYAPKLPTHKLDLNGDGTDEVVRGHLDTWTNQPVQIFSTDGKTSLGAFAPDPQHRIRAVKLEGHDRQVFLYEIGEPDKPHAVTILYLSGSRVFSVAGWDPNMTRTTGNSIAVGPDGLIAVEWNLGDPAGHRRVRKYRFAAGERPSVALQSTSFVPAGNALEMPANHADLLLAAFVARWYNLKDEMPRYFASAQAAAAFASEQRITEPARPGEVLLGKIADPTAPGSCGAKVNTAPVGEDGAAEFSATWRTFGSCTAVWGRVTFANDDKGQLRIQQILIDGHRLLPQ